MSDNTSNSGNESTGGKMLDSVVRGAGYALGGAVVGGVVGTAVGGPAATAPCAKIGAKAGLAMSGGDGGGAEELGGLIG